MTILRDSRASKFRDILISFVSIQAHHGQGVFYPPGTGGATQFLAQKLGVPRRWFYGPHPVTGKGVWWAVAPKVGANGPRSEASFAYELATVIRFFMWKVCLPSTGRLAWVTDTGSACVIGQWHEQYQPNGGRPPPFGLDAYDDAGGTRLRLTISEDGGTGNSGSVIPATLHAYELGYIEKDRDYLLAIRCKAAGAADDFLTMWLDGVQVVNYTGYVGYPHYNGSSVYDQQNFFKIGAYCYFATNSPPTYRAIAHSGALIGDQAETIDSMTAAYNADVAVTSHVRTRVAVAVLGGSNVAGASGSGAVNRALYGQPCQDPVAPATAYQASLAPALSNRLAECGFGPNVANCAQVGLGMTSYVGRCRGQHATGTSYLVGDSVIPAAPVGLTAYLDLGLKFICEAGGVSAGSAPIWPTTEYGTVVDGGVTWRAERRETYDVAGHTYEFGELGYDPLGLLSQALSYVDQIPAVDRKVLLLMPGLDAAQNSDIGAAIGVISSVAGILGIQVIVSTQVASGILDDAQLGQVGRAAAHEI